MEKISRIAVDTSKAVFTLHGVDERDRVVLRRTLRRGGFEALMAGLPACEVVLEACGGSHHWGRRLAARGHQVRLIPPQYVKPFVKRGKNDRNDAEAISEAASRPSMRFVPVKSAETQTDAMVLTIRELLVGQRTQLENALRGHATEFGVVAAKGIAQVAGLLAALAENEAIPPLARAMMDRLGRQISRLDDELAELEARLLAQHKANPLSRRLAKIPGVGPIIALTLATTVDPTRFKSGRHLAAWIGLTPRERSTGGKQRLGGISRAGNERLRALLVSGAMAVIGHARPAAAQAGRRSASPWLLQLLERRPRKLAAVALANKTARIAWAMMCRGEDYRVQQQPA